MSPWTGAADTREAADSPSRSRVPGSVDTGRGDPRSRCRVGWVWTPTT